MLAYRITKLVSTPERVGSQTAHGITVHLSRHAGMYPNLLPLCCQGDQTTRQRDTGAAAPKPASPSTLQQTNIFVLTNSSCSLSPFSASSMLNFT
jgi:hypothetical protein